MKKLKIVVYKNFRLPTNLTSYWNLYQQILLNVVHNSIKFNKHEGRIEISFSLELPPAGSSLI